MSDWKCKCGREGNGYEFVKNGRCPGCNQILDYVDVDKLLGQMKRDEMRREVDHRGYIYRRD